MDSLVLSLMIWTSFEETHLLSPLKIFQVLSISDLSSPPWQESPFQEVTELCLSYFYFQSFQDTF